VGIPTYARPEGLRRTLRCIVGQTYDNLEIIVSDNSSPGDETSRVASEFKASDPRVQYVRQRTNAGSIENCRFLVREATGDYFMWAADDDAWSPTFVERCVGELLLSGSPYVAVGMEAQYVVGNDEREFFAEGRAFYSDTMDDPASRVAHMLRHGYGNLFYSVFRREALVHGEMTALDFAEPHGNELPMLVDVAARGNWKVLPSVGLYKQTNEQTYIQARWESCGGWLRPWSPTRFRVRQLVSYHAMVAGDIQKSLHRVGFDPSVERRLQRLTQRYLGGHVLSLMLGYKRRATQG
jgi:glycosyltransferase involved in cell wall biosynthesis